MKTIVAVGSIALLACVWASGCATQADLQAQSRENEQLRTQLADSRVANEAMRREVEKVRGEMEELRYRVDRVAKTRTTPVASPAQVQGLEERVVTLERQLAVQRETSIPHPAPAIPPPSAAMPPPLRLTVSDSLRSPQTLLPRQIGRASCRERV